MNYHQYYPVDVVNGPGTRCTLFVSGCVHQCPGCYNKSTWRLNSGRPFTAELRSGSSPTSRTQRSPAGHHPVRRRSAPSAERTRRSAPGKTSARGMPRQGYLAVDGLCSGGADRGTAAGGVPDQCAGGRQIRSGSQRSGVNLARQQQSGYPLPALIAVPRLHRRCPPGQRTQLVGLQHRHFRFRLRRKRLIQ